MNLELGERLRGIRERLNLKQKDFAKELGVSAPTLSDLESGKSKPGFDVLINLSEKFKVNIYYVLFGKGEMFENPVLEFLLNMREKDMAAKAEDIRIFLEHFGKSRRLQYHILNQYEDKMMDDGKKILQEIAAKENIEE